MKKLDLHRVRHVDVRDKTIRFIESHWGSGEEIEIITGNSYKMKKLVVEVLSEYDLTYHNPYFDVNRGCLRIVME